MTNRVNPAHSPAARADVARLAFSPAPEPLRIDCLDLRASMCRWPFGDAKAGGVSFCGHQREPGVSYCPHHARLAYQPPKRRERSLSAVRGWPSRSDEFGEATPCA